MKRSSIKCTVSSSDTDPADTFGSINVWGEAQEENYPAEMSIDTQDGFAQMAITREQAIRLRDTLTKIIEADH